MLDDRSGLATVAKERRSVLPGSEVERDLLTHHVDHAGRNDSSSAKAADVQHVAIFDAMHDIALAAWVFDVSHHVPVQPPAITVSLAACEHSRGMNWPEGNRVVCSVALDLGESVAAVHHPHVVQFIEACRVHERVGIVVE